MRITMENIILKNLEELNLEEKLLLIKKYHQINLYTVEINFLMKLWNI